jgi:transcription initiation factor TFIIF subunit alpha
MPKPKQPPSIFHPKKKGPVPSPSPRKPTNTPPGPPIPQVDDDEEELKLPQGAQIVDYKILSSATHGWKYDVMKFESRRPQPVDLFKWAPPIKLNRKDMRRNEVMETGAPQAVRPMLGPDGNQVIGANGKPVMVDFEGRVVTEDGGGGSSAKSKGPGGRKPFKKKTHQVFLVDEQTRQLRKEERYPWVFEDASGQEVWTGQLDDLEKSQSHAFFMPTANLAFKFVPSHRWYKFQKKLNHDMPRDTMTVENAVSN